VRRDREEFEAKARAEDEAEIAEQQMIQYECAKAEYHAATKLSFARILAAEARGQTLRGKTLEGQRLLARAETRYREVIDLYPDTESAADAKQLLEGKDVPTRPVPPPPTLPGGIKASEDDIREQDKDKKESSPTAKPLADVSGPVYVVRPASRVGPVYVGYPTFGRPRTVYVRAYTRKDGTHVRSHYRSAPRRRR
jgi:hypothetical protein